MLQDVFGGEKMIGGNYMITKGETDMMLSAMPAWASDEIKKQVSNLNDISMMTADNTAFAMHCKDTIERIIRVLEDKVVGIYISSRKQLTSADNKLIAMSIVAHHASPTCICRVQMCRRY